MAQRNVLILNQTVLQIQEPQVGDTYLLPRDAEIQGNLTISGNVDGVDVAAMGALAASATQPTDNLSTLTNDLIASQGEAEAGSNNVKMMTPLRVAQVIAILAAGLKNNYTSVVDPGTTDDDVAGYSVGSVWINTATDEAFRCVDATTNLAVWIKTTVTAADLATVALSGNSDDLTEGAAKLLMTVAERAKIADLSGIVTGITAFAGGGQASATVLTSHWNMVDTVAAPNDSVKLPVATIGMTVVVKNRGASSMNLFPQSGVQINTLGNDVAIAISAGAALELVALSATQWESV